MEINNAQRALVLTEALPYIQKYAGKIDIYKVDVDTDRAVPRAYKIKSVPTLIFAPLNADRQMMHGDMTMAQLSEAIENILLDQQ